MKNYDRFLKKLKDPNEKLVVFLGAGISRVNPSFAPLAYQIKNSTFKHICKRHNLNTHYDLLVNGKNLALTKKFENMPLESFLQKIMSPVGLDTLKIFQVVDLGRPNFNHYLFCILLDKGYINFIVTTNQDSYLETAYNELLQKGLVKKRLNLCIRPNIEFDVITQT